MLKERENILPYTSMQIKHSPHGLYNVYLIYLIFHVYFLLFYVIPIFFTVPFTDRTTIGWEHFL